MTLRRSMPACMAGNSERGMTAQRGGTMLGQGLQRTQRINVLPVWIALQEQAHTRWPTVCARRHAHMYLGSVEGAALSIVDPCWVALDLIAQPAITWHLVSKSAPHAGSVYTHMCPQASPKSLNVARTQLHEHARAYPHESAYS